MRTKPLLPTIVLFIILCRTSYIVGYDTCHNDLQEQLNYAYEQLEWRRFGASAEYSTYADSVMRATWKRVVYDSTSECDSLAYPYQKEYYDNLGINLKPWTGIHNQYR